jgi:hypothetical protein
MSEIEGVLAAASVVEGFCRGRNWRFCFIGGIAVQRWGMPRFTQDVDLTLLAGWGNEAEFVDAILGHFQARRTEMRKFALQRRVVLVKTAAGVDIDIALGALPFEERSIERATAWTVGGLALTTCSAEDLLVHKVVASRDRDWGDVDSVLLRQHGKLNLDLVRQEIEPLLELGEDAESMGKLERMIESVARRVQKGELH